MTLLAAVAAVIFVPPLLSDDDGSGGVVLEAGEVFLAPAADLGPDPFSETPLADPPDTQLALAAPATEVEIPSDSPVEIGSNSGGEPGLYGGTRDDSSCDRDALIQFLQANPAKAQAWVSALDADPDLDWDGPLTTAGIEAYISELTPLVLRMDTRVTNHGYVDGVANPIPSVLQRGTAVLVDARGVPRAKCSCGNPLISPTPTERPPTYVGKQWPDFDRSTIVVVNPSPTVITRFVFIDLDTGEEVSRPAGSTGDTDTDADDPDPTEEPTETPPADPEPTVEPDPTAEPEPEPDETSVAVAGCPTIEPAQVVCYDVTGSTEDEIRASMNASRPADPFDNNLPVDALTQWFVSWGWDGYGTGNCDLSTANVTLTVDVTMPRWIAPSDAPPALVDKWNTYVENLTLHEKGHVDNIAENYLDVRTAIQGATCATAESEAQATLDVIGQFDRDYDRDTVHGATQGATFP